MQKVLIFGACSAIAHETAKLIAKDDVSLFLADLSIERLESVKQDILIRTDSKCKIFIEQFNALDFYKHEFIVEKAITSLNGLDTVLIAHGSLPDQRKAEKSISLTLQEIAINGTSVISLATIIANYFENQKKGCITCISSVAGDRGRLSNYIYGAGKGIVTIFLQGLRNRLYSSNVNVITIKPGFVDTPMTAHLKKNPLYSKPYDIAKGIYNAMLNNKNGDVYLPGFWKFIMLIIIHIPGFIFNKLKL